MPGHRRHGEGGTERQRDRENERRGNGATEVMPYSPSISSSLCLSVPPSLHLSISPSLRLRGSVARSRRRYDFCSRLRTSPSVVKTLSANKSSPAAPNFIF